MGSAGRPKLAGHLDAAGLATLSSACNTDQCEVLVVPDLGQTHPASRAIVCLTSTYKNGVIVAQGGQDPFTLQDNMCKAAPVSLCMPCRLLTNPSLLGCTAAESHMAGGGVPKAS